MAGSESKERPRSGEADQFETTQWSAVLAAGQDTTAESREALAKLCEAYWFPLYAFIRRKGATVDDAKDLTQGFFAQLIEKGFLKEVRRERGKFRAFLLTALKHYMANERRRDRAQKRGGGQTPSSLDFDVAEGTYRLESAEELTPEKLYERQWAMTLLDQVSQSLSEEYAQSGKGAFFDTLRPFLTGEEPRGSYAQVAGELAMTEGAVKVAVHRLRKRFGAVLRREIAQTLTPSDDVEDEIRHLFTVFG